MSTHFFCPRCRERITSEGGSHATCPGCGLVVDLALADTNAGAPSFAPIRDLAGEAIGHYLLHECLGSGGMGAVYRATDTRAHTEVALKLLSPALVGQPDLLERFHREAQALAGLNHVNIVGFHEEGQAGSHHYIAMEYVAGESLETHLARETPAPERALEIVTAIAEALRVAHEQGVVHRDLKPANVIVTGDTIKVLDFGIAHIALEDLTLTHSNAILGTVNYMAPEQRTHARQVDHRADIFSLGVLFYRMLTGTLPLGAFEAPSRLSAAVPRGYDRVVERMLHRDPDRRHADADRLLADLHALDPPPGRVARISAWSTTAAAAVLTAVAVLMNVNAADDLPPAAKDQAAGNLALAAKDQAAGDLPPAGQNQAAGNLALAAKDQAARDLPPAGQNQAAGDLPGRAAVVSRDVPATPKPRSPPDESATKPTAGFDDAEPVQPARLGRVPLVNAKAEVSTASGTRHTEAKRKRKKKRPPKVARRSAGPKRRDPAASAASATRPAYVGARGSVLYVASTAQSDLIRPLEPGETVEVVDVRRGRDKRYWAEVRTSRGEAGYVRNSTLGAERPPAHRKGGKLASQSSYPPPSEDTSQAVELRDAGPVGSDGEGEEVVAD